IRYNFEDKKIGNVYEEKVKPHTAIVQGEQYDMQKLLMERENLYLSAKNLGYFDYLRQYMRIGVDTNIVGNQANLSMTILKPDSTDQQVYTINNVFLTVQEPNVTSGSFVPEYDSTVR